MQGYERETLRDLELMCSNTLAPLGYVVGAMAALALQAITERGEAGITPQGDLVWRVEVGNVLADVQVFKAPNGARAIQARDASGGALRQIWATDVLETAELLERHGYTDSAETLRADLASRLSQDSQ